MAVPERVSWGTTLAAAERHALGTGQLTGLTDDSRAVRPGYIFVARRGLTLDGHAFVLEATARGAALLVVEREVRGELPTCIVADGRKALSALADAWFGHPSRRLRVMGVTGTNGKTTTTWWLAAILEAAGIQPCVVGNLGWVLAGRRRRLPWTTPPPVELHRLLSEGVAEGAKAAVLEVSAQSLSQSRVDHCAFDAAAITNLAREHGEYYPDASAYRDAKLRLFHLLLGRQHKPAQAVINAGLKDLAAFRTACGPTPVVTYGSGGEVAADTIETHGLLGTEVVLRQAGERGALRVQLRLPGRHNVENALCAAALAACVGVPNEAVAAGLANLHHVPGRFQILQRRPFSVIVDYAHNPSALRMLLGCLRSATPGRLILVVGARGQRDPGKRALMGAVAAAFCDLVVLTADRPAGEDPSEAVETMRAAVVDLGIPVTFERDRLRSLEFAVTTACAGDCVVVVGKGEEVWGADDTVQEGEYDDVSVLQILLAPYEETTSPIACTAPTTSRLSALPAGSPLEPFSPFLSSPRSTPHP